jgi:tripartite-type tricarboxylate transporter receptor subunit TctC
VRLVLAFTAGSAIDVIGRPVAERLTKVWGQPVIVDNRAGAGGSVGANVVAKANPDGHTLLLHTNAHATNAALYGDLPFDPVADFRVVAPFASQPYVLVVSASTAPKTVRDLIGKAKAKPGSVSFGSAGTGSGTHFVAEKFRLAAGIDAVHVPYKGGPEANADVMTGRIEYWFPPHAAAMALIPGKLNALAVTTASRSPHLPNVPTLAESGLPGFDSSFWSAIWAPAAIRAPLAERIGADIARVLAEPEMRERLGRFGAQPITTSPSDFTRTVRREIDESTRIVKLTGMKVQ